MSLVRLFARRIALGVFAIWAVLSLIFVLFTMTDDWLLDRNLAMEARGGTTPETVAEMREAYLAERGLDRPLGEQYVDWMGNMLTLEWGESFRTGEAVFPAVMDATVRTALYVVPALVLATTLGLVVGLYTALHARSRRDRAVRTLSYLSFGLPNFWVGAMILAAAGVGMGFQWERDINWIQQAQFPFVYEYVLPPVLVATTLLAAIVSYARSYSLRYRSAAFTKLVRAKGGGTRTVARHILRNASVPLVSLVFAETFALIAISVIVIEAVFAIGGLGHLFFNSVWTRDLPMLMGASLVIIVIGVLGNIAQDLAYSALDPRVDADTR